ncbi:type III secretion system outer membrane ring subunit SctC [Sphingomonas sp. AP4-R1]|uniref:type III secretion system outer membrane ring subunit SctC n=1 Tax=Sphingomonas sp. AP4-R1 TaxID=2735134 RepID=UPI0014933AF6|nr:type III secretion system outer membrane ring subunit SctC [Sphingomonas sp. AP4-R1]QJU59900.1 type III secretion system outer membrane ring subunit SctC [Sphingomonas sp. AP4-R1]
MPASRLPFALRLAALAAAASPLLAPAAAAPMPMRPVVVSILAREEPIGDFVRDLFGRVGVPVVVGQGLTGTINGQFNGPAAKVFDDVAKAFNLVGYYDGAAAYVYAASELTVQTLNLDPAAGARVARQVQAQGFTDARNMVRASPDGTLVASGTPRFVEQVGTLARGGRPSVAVAGAGGSAAGTLLGASPRLPYESLDPQPLEFRVFYLRYARAEDTTMEAGGREIRVPGLATIVQNLVLDRRAPSNNFGSYPIRQSATRLKGQGMDSIRPNVSQTPLLGLPMGGIYPTGPATAPQTAMGFAEDGAAAPLTSDIIRVEANPFTNALIVRDVPARMSAYDSLIRALDVEPQMVEVEATIVDINVDKLRQLGINWRFNSGGFGALFGQGNANGNDGDIRLLPTDGSRRGNVENITPSALGGTISTIIGSHREFLTRITALEQKGAARIVSRPEVMTLSNVEAVFDRTRTFYVRVAGREEVDLFNVTAGIVLRVNPHVFRDHDQTRIRMLINIEDGQLSQQSVVDNIPIVDRSSVATQAMVLNGESLLLGGMTSDAETNDITKVPLLGDIPLLGNLFKTRSKQRGHTERLFLITPRLATLSSGVGTVTVSKASEAAQPFQSNSPERVQ